MFSSRLRPSRRHFSVGCLGASFQVHQSNENKIFIADEISTTRLAIMQSTMLSHSNKFHLRKKSLWSEHSTLVCRIMRLALLFRLFLYVFFLTLIRISQNQLLEASMAGSERARKKEEKKTSSSRKAKSFKLRTNNTGVNSEIKLPLSKHLPLARWIHRRWWISHWNECAVWQRVSLSCRCSARGFEADAKRWILINKIAH